MRGFSLIELVTVVVIIGVIAAIAAPRMSRGAEHARAAGIVASLRQLDTAMRMYHAENGAWPPDGDTGKAPEAFKLYLPGGKWPRGVLGGSWDNETNDNGVVAAVGLVVDETAANLEVLAEVDRLLDNGDLKTGVFRKTAAKRFYFVAE